MTVTSTPAPPTTAPSDLTCPSAATVDKALQLGVKVTSVKCLHGNAWLIVRGVLPSTGQQADGVDLVHQVKQGTFADMGAGSDFGPAVAALRAKGVPDDVIAQLPGVSLATTSAAPAHPYSDYVGQWGRHEGSLVIKANHTGRLILGIGCCDSVSVPMAFEVAPNGLVQATASGRASYTGTAMNGVRFDGGQVIWLHFEATDVGQMLVSTSPGDSGEIYWCSPQQVGQCGA